MTKITALILSALLVGSVAYSDELIKDFEEDSVAVLNEELRILRRSIQEQGTSLTGSQAIVLLDTITAAGESAIEITDGITSAYKKYIIEITGLYGSVTNAELQMRVSSDGGANYIAENYRWRVEFCEVGSASYAARIGSSTNTEINLTDAASNIYHGADNPIQLSLDLYNPSNAVSHTARIIGRLLMSDNGGAASGGTVIAEQYAAGSCNAVKFYFDSGNIDGGTFKLYGVK